MMTAFAGRVGLSERVQSRADSTVVSTNQGNTDTVAVPLGNCTRDGVRVLISEPRHPLPATVTDQALAAAEFYCTRLPDRRIERIDYSPEGHDKGEPGAVLVAEFTLG